MSSWFDIIYDPPVALGDAYPLFTRLSLETCNTCTRRCSFCCVGERGTELKLMTYDLFDKIVTQLEELKWSGVVQWFYLNEPLMDKRCLRWIDELRRRLPKVCIHLTTNTDTFKKPALQAESLIAAGVNVLNFNAYDDKTWDKLMVDTYPFTVHTEQAWGKMAPSRFRFSICDMRHPPLNSLHNWGQSVEHSSIREKTGQACARPHRHMVIQWNGQVPVCCASNPVKAEVLADLNEIDLIGAWNSPGFHKYRWNLQNKNRVNDCTGCVEKMAYPHVIRRVEEYVDPSVGTLTIPQEAKHSVDHEEAVR